MRKLLLLNLLLVCAVASMAQNEINFNKAAALQLVQANKKAIGLADSDLNNLLVSSSYSVSGTGMTMVYLQQTYKGIPVSTKMKVLAFKDDQLVSNAGILVGEMEKFTAGSAGIPSISAEQAVRLAFAEEQLNAPAISVTRTADNGRIIEYGKPAGVTETVTASLMWFPVEKDSLVSVRLGWEIQVAPKGTDDVWHIRIDALTGQLIEKINIVLYEDFTAKKASHSIITDGIKNRTQFSAQDFGSPIGVNRQTPGSPNVVNSANYNVIPYPFEAPTFAPAAIRNNPWTSAPGNATSLGWHNDGTTDYNTSRGNNVWASEDTLGTDNNTTGLSATSTTALPNLNFNFTPNYTVEPSMNATMQQFCITNLFYWNNIVHDITYQYGFDEVAGNYQQDNQGRGGLGNDYVQAFAQSAVGPTGHQHIGNNANFTPTVDGVKGRMRMYLFSPVTTLHVNAPPSIAGDYQCVEGAFSTNNKLAAVGPVTGPVVYYNDIGGTHEACTAASNTLTGKIVIIDRGNCNFTQKVAIAQAEGAIAVIMVNNAPNALVTMAGDDNSITIPAVFITMEDGAILKAQLANGLNVTLSGTAVFDGDLDAGIMVHEYTHGISNRLTGGPATASCLNNAERGGEGWSDYFALMLTTNWATTAVSAGANPRPVGTYVVNELPGGEGIRNYPYSTNLSVNPLTYAHMGLGSTAPWIFGNGSEVHNIGEIWCAALWEMTWGIIQQENSINTNLYNFSFANNGGNSIALKLVMEGMRLQPCSPGYIDARNAILTADKNLYNGRHQCAIWTAFAKRGMGYSALQGSSNSTTDQTAAFDLPPAPVITGQPNNASVNPGDNASFSVTATAPVNGAYLIYNWQVSTDGGATWNNVVPANNTATLNLTAVTAAMNGNKYRCVITQGCATTNSVAALLTVAVPAGFTFSTPAPTVAACPAPNTMDVVLGTSAFGGFTNAITVTAGTAPAGTSVSFVPSATVTPGNSVTVRLTGTSSLAPGSYTIVITGTATGATTQTANVTFTISAGTPPAITAQPTDQTVCAGGNASFSITSASATGFQWQISTDGGATWNNQGNGGVYSGATTATLTITGATAAMNNNRYRAIASTVCGSTTSSAGILTVNSPAVITGQPANASVCTGANTTFTATVTGSSLTYQWYISTDGGGTFNILPNGGVYSGATTASLTITGVTAGLNNNQYRVVVGGVCPVSTITSNAATLSVATALSITAQPVDATVCSGANTGFTVTAAGAGSYQWQFSTDGGATWNNVTNGGVYAGATTATLSLTGVTTALNGNRYRVNLTSSCGNATSTSALLTVNALPAIGTQPASATLCAGSNNTFTVAATGTGLTYQWQISSNGCAGPWTDIALATSSSYTLTGITAGQNNTAYRVVVSGTCAPAVTSNCALLTVVTAVNITSQPSSQEICEGANTSFTVAGSGTGIIYQWQVSTDGGATWNNVNNGGVYSGATTATLNITGATLAMNNNRYRAQLSNASCTTPGVSNAAILTVNRLPGISTQPTAATICVGGNNTFTAAAVGTNISYQWQVSTTGCAGTFTNVVNGGVYSGATTAALTITGAPVTMNGYAYKLLVTGICNPAVTTNCVVLTVGSTVTISAQPADQTICSGSNAVFNVTGSGTGILYQWQLSTDGGTTWNNIAGATAASYTVTSATTAMNNNRYRVLLSNSTCTTPATSTAALLTVRQLPTVGLSAAPYTALLPGQTTTLTATPSASSGGVLTYSWFKDGAPFANAGTTYVADITKLGAYQVRIQETFGSGLTCSNQSATVDITALVSNNLFIFPSPNDGIFSVTYYNNGGAASTRSVTVYDSKGSKVYFAKFPITGPYTILKIDIQPAQRGIYYVVVADNAGKKLADGKVMVNW